MKPWCDEMKLLTTEMTLILITFDFDFDFIRRDLVVETFRNKFSYLYHFIITRIYTIL